MTRMATRARILPLILLLMLLDLSFVHLFCFNLVTEEAEPSSSRVEGRDVELRDTTHRPGQVDPHDVISRPQHSQESPAVSCGW